MKKLKISTKVSNSKVNTIKVLDNMPKSIREIKSGEKERYDTGLKELNRVLGGGLVRGSLTLISGDPGIGKIYITTTNSKCYF